VSWITRLRNRWRERDLAREFDDELRFHLDARVEANRRRGLTPADAEAEAKRHLGNTTRAKEEMRDARVVTWLDGLGGDLRYGIRMLYRQPLLTGLVVLTLSLGIGANAAIFSVFEAVLLRPLPFSQPDRLVLLFDGDRSERGVTSPTIPELLDVRAASRTLAGVAYFDTRDFQLAGGDEPQRVIGARVDPSLLSMLGVRPERGRLFDYADRTMVSSPSDATIVVLSNGLWRRNFGADPNIVGRTLSLNGASHEVVGVLPETFGFEYLGAVAVDLYLPYPASPAYTSRAGEFANVRRVVGIARLAPGMTVDAANAELGGIANAMSAAHPDLYRSPGASSASGFFMSAMPLRESLTAQSRPILLMLLGAVGLLLVIASVNTAHFLLAQAVDREPEVAVRAALGAGRGRLLRQFVVEALLLTVASGLVGVAQAAWLSRTLSGLVPRGTVIVGNVGLDGSVLLFLMATTIVTAVCCTIVPALRFSRGDLAQRFGTRGASQGRGRLRDTFVAAEVAMSVVMLASAGLLLQSLHELQRAQGGFSTDRVSVLRVRGFTQQLGDVFARYAERISDVSGVEAVGAASAVFPGRPTVNFSIIGAAAPASGETRQQSTYQIVSGGYFSVMGIPLIAGRVFTNDDTTGKPPVTIVNEELAERYFPDGAIGRQVRSGEGPRAATMTIVGIVGNVRAPFQAGDVPQLYVPHQQQGEPNMAFIVRTAPHMPLPLAQIKQAIWSVDSRQAVFGVIGLSEQVAFATAFQRALAILIGGFAILAVAISLSGIYAVITYLVSRRFREIAVRRAIGATAADVVRSLANPTLRWTAVGLVVGAIGAFSATRLLRAAVTGLLPLQPSLVSVVTASYFVVVVLVIAVASRGALRIDPAAALRGE
jgi:putative ABC transport system permease protein